MMQVELTTLLKGTPRDLPPVRRGPPVDFTYLGGGVVMLFYNTILFGPVRE